MAGNGGVLMAYMINLPSCRDCVKRASVEVRDRWNGSNGVFCRTCGMRELKLQKKREEEAE